MKKHAHVVTWIVVPMMVGGVAGFFLLERLPQWVAPLVFVATLLGMTTLPFLTPKSSRIVKAVVFLLLLNVGSLIGGLTSLLFR
jgi:Na+-translocating ferredoxin:NAD+ oxidoreductase RnfD subunit